MLTLLHFCTYFLKHLLLTTFSAFLPANMISTLSHDETDMRYRVLPLVTVATQCFVIAGKVLAKVNVVAMYSAL
jgi:hypothetical protein